MPVIVVSGHATVHDAVNAIKLGATDFFEKPLNRERVLVSVKNTLRASKLSREVAILSAEIEARYELDASGLRTTISATNRGPDRAPWGTSAHPWLAPATDAVPLAEGPMVSLRGMRGRRGRLRGRCGWRGDQRCACTDRSGPLRDRRRRYPPPRAKDPWAP